MTQLTVTDLCSWEKDFSKPRHLHPNNLADADKRLARTIIHIQEELGEASRAWLDGKPADVMEELADIVLMVSKMSNILSEFYNTENLNSALERKMKFNEKRQGTRVSRNQS